MEVWDWEWISWVGWRQVKVKLGERSMGHGVLCRLSRLCVKGEDVGCTGEADGGEVCCRT